MSAKEAVLKAVNRVMTDELKLQYRFDGFAGVPTYPYFVGVYAERGRSAAENKVLGVFTIKGWTQADGHAPTELMALEELIKARFTGFIDRQGTSSVAIDTATSRPMGSDGALKVIEITMDVRAFGL